MSLIAFSCFASEYAGVGSNSTGLEVSVQNYNMKKYGYSQYGLAYNLNTKILKLTATGEGLRYKSISAGALCNFIVPVEYPNTEEIEKVLTMTLNGVVRYTNGVISMEIQYPFWFFYKNEYWQKNRKIYVNFAISLRGWI